MQSCEAMEMGRVCVRVALESTLPSPQSCVLDRQAQAPLRRGQGRRLSEVTAVTVPSAKLFTLESAQAQEGLREGFGQREGTSAICSLGNLH